MLSAPRQPKSAASSRGLALLLCLALFSAVALPNASQATTYSLAEAPDKDASQQINFVPGEVLVRFRADAVTTMSAAPVAMKLQRGDHSEVRINIEHFAGADLVQGLRLARVASGDTLQAVAALRARPDVIYAEPNYIRRRDAIPNDSLYAELWGLKNAGQAGGTAGADTDAEPAWGSTTGSRNVVVGVIDEGIDVNHPDLQANIWRNPGEVPGNGTDDDSNGFVDDINGWDFHHNDASVYDGTFSSSDTDAHGTHVAGTIGAAGDNNQGITGVNWQVSLMSLKILGATSDPAAPSSVSRTVRAYRYAKMMRDLYVSSGGSHGANVRVLNNSYGGAGKSQTELDAINALNDSGILFVAAAGNSSEDTDQIPHYPSNYTAPNLISVAATDRSDNLSSFSNFGRLSVGIGAPGSAILSTTPNGEYNSYSGTSMAAPHVAGAAALICAAHPNMSVRQLRSALLYSGDVVPALTGKTFTGRRLNIFNALTTLAKNDVTPPGPVNDLRITSQNNRSIRLAWTAPGDDGSVGRAALYELRFTDRTAGEQVSLTTLTPDSAGTPQSATVTIPYRHVAGRFTLRAIDSAGNEGATSVDVSINADAAEPYVMQLGAASVLTVGGTPLALTGDDRYREGYALPFAFPFFGQQHSSVSVSINGALYFSAPPRRSTSPNPPEEVAADGYSSTDVFKNHAMIAGLWDDLRTDTRPGDDVYVVTPDADRIIFRWQAVTYNTPLSNSTTRGENPVNFEIELHRSGLIQVRYGNGNTRLLPVVGISPGEPDPYIVGSHTSSYTINLTNAQIITFTPKSAAILTSTPTPTPTPPPPQTSTPTPTPVPTPAPPPAAPSPDGVMQFGAPAYSAAEETESIQILVTRAGDISNASAISYATNGGSASDRSNYTAASGTLSFAAGETSKLFTVLIIDNALVEGNKTINLILSNPSGGSLGSQSTATLTVIDNDIASSVNPIDSSLFYVRQHYYDFLNRVADASGLAFWASEIASCGSDLQCVETKRINVSAAYFLSIEFQQTGYLAYRFYRASYGRIPRLREFLPSTQQIGQGVVVGAPGWEQKLEENKRLFAESWVNSASFISEYPAEVTPAQYVDKLWQSAGVTPNQAERDVLIAGLTSGTETRATVLRKVADNGAFYRKEFNRAFVLMQYFGYLRRNPDDAPDGNMAGYNFWLQKLNEFGGDFQKAEMVKAFVTSPEYRKRFGQ